MSSESSDASDIMFMDASTLKRLLPMADVIEIVEGAMMDLSSGKLVAPQRWAMPLSDQRAIGLMPGAYTSRGVYGVKVLSLFGPEVRKGAPGHQGLMLLFDLDAGRPLAVLDANVLTGLRTAAASAVATRLLAKPDASILALVGHGEQARWHVDAMRRVRPIKDVRVWGRSQERARAFADRYLGDFERVEVAREVSEAVRGADVICTLTHAPKAVLSGVVLEAGQHLNLVGSSVAAFYEVDEVAVARSLYIADCRKNVLSQAGELIHAIQVGAVTADHVHAELGEVLAGVTTGRDGPEAITLFKSLGHIAQDLAVAQEALARAERSDVRRPAAG